MATNQVPVTQETNNTQVPRNRTNPNALLMARVAGRKQTMAYFRERYSDQSIPTIGNARFRLGDRTPVNYVTAEDDTHAGRLIKTLSVAINTSDSTDQGEQICSYLFAIITVIFPGLLGSAMEAVRQLGGEPTERKLPESNDICLLEMETNAHPTYCLCVFAQAVFILFKNLSPQNYDTFMQKRINALKSVVGAMPADTQFLLAKQERGIMLSKRVGSCKMFKKDLLNEMIEIGKQEHEFGRLCAYIISMLA